MIDLAKRQDIHQLYAAMEASKQASAPFRKKRVAMLKEFVGSWYSDQGAPLDVLVNLLNLTADAYTIGLASQNPRVRTTTEFRELWPFAFRYQQNLNNFIKEIRYAQTLQLVVLDAFFTGGISKVYLREWESIQLDDDVWADPGRPYIGRISPDHFIMDMSVNDVRRCKFMRDDYRVPWSKVRSDPDFDKAVVRQLAPNSKWDRDEETANQISAGSITDGDELEPMIDLMDVWLPELKAVGVFPVHAETRPLKLVDEGREGGPYEYLSFADVPDNIIPSSPAQNLMGLHLLYNGLLRKQARQAKRQKTNPTFRPSGAEDAERLKRYNDGDWVKVNDPSSINVVTQGGVDPANVAFSIAVLDLFDRQAGNLRAMAGLGPQAPTLGQEQLIYSAASRKEAKMQQRVHEHVSRLMEAVGHLMWVDEALTMQSNYEVAPGSGIFVDTSWEPWMREGDFWQYNFEVEPYSTNYVAPETKAQKMDMVVAKLLEMYPILQEQGGTIDVQQLMRAYQELLPLPELANVITFAVPSSVPRPGPAGGEQSRMPANTTRNYVRRNVPTGGTPESRSATLQQAFLRSGQANQQQMEALTR